MLLPVNEIFYSLQGEGRFTGTPATFIRLAGCNLSCPFCDTDHRRATPTAIDDIVRAALRNPSRHVIVTGGEPSIHDIAPLVDMLHAHGFFVQVETNGTNPLPDTIDFITCSPKDSPVKLSRIDEVKLLFLPRYLTGNRSAAFKLGSDRTLSSGGNGNLFSGDNLSSGGDNHDATTFCDGEPADNPDLTLSRLLPAGLKPGRYALQPCDTGEPYTNSRILDATIGYILRHPHWNLSLQTHKLISIK